MLNTRYPDFMRKPVPLRLSLQYTKEVKEGDCVTIAATESCLSAEQTDTENNTILWQIRNENGETSAVARLIKLNR